MGAAPGNDGFAIPPATHVSSLLRIWRSLEQELSKREHTRNQTALPGWAGQDWDGGTGSKWQRAGPGAVGGVWAAAQTGASAACTPQSFTGAQGTSRHQAGCAGGKMGPGGGEDVLGLELTVCFPPPPPDFAAC